MLVRGVVDGRVEGTRPVVLMLVSLDPGSPSSEQGEPSSYSTRSSTRRPATGLIGVVSTGRHSRGRGAGGRGARGHLGARDAHAAAGAAPPGEPRLAPGVRAAGQGRAEALELGLQRRQEGGDRGQPQQQ
eukprot:1189324-Prorocentrum_minimum.AAC.2